LTKQAQPADTNSLQREVLAATTYSAAMQEARRQPGPSRRLLTINHRRPDGVGTCRTTEPTSDCDEEVRRHG
jgi:hypothetical protein